MAVVEGGARPGPARAELRQAMRALHMAELRESVWVRPDNLVGGGDAAADRVVDAQCVRWVARLAEADATGDVHLASRLWDLTGWADLADELQVRLDQVVGPLEDRDTDALAPGFVLSAAVLRHLLADPLLPEVLLPPNWPGAALRDHYDRYDRAFKATWRAWFRRERDRGR
jgi:phenylacetic acid degradation operon negative regulatory protein